MSILVASHPSFALHDPGPGHPERPARLEAVHAGLRASQVWDDLVFFEPGPAGDDDIAAVHPGRYLRALEEFTVAGGGWLDGDTAAVEASYEATRRAAGAGLEAVARLDAGEGSAAFCAVRPPGHHATPTRPMGFCLVNNVAVTARHLAARGERVLIVDYDAHHGNGVQDTFWSDPSVVYVSTHEYPLYPGTGAIDEAGAGDGAGTTFNFPLPAGATGDICRRALERVVQPEVDRWRPDWLLVSAGFDAHRADPLTGLNLLAGDFADLTRELLGWVPPSRCILFLEGGYDLAALTDSVAATVAALAGVDTRPEPATSDGPGSHVVDTVLRRREMLHVDPLPAREPAREPGRGPGRDAASGRSEGAPGTGSDRVAGAAGGPDNVGL